MIQNNKLERTLVVASSHYLARGMVETHRSTVFNHVVIPEIIQQGSWTNKMRITAAGEN